VKSKKKFDCGGLLLDRDKTLKQFCLSILSEYVRQYRFADLFFKDMILEK